MAAKGFVEGLQYLEALTKAIMNAQGEGKYCDISINFDSELPPYGLSKYSYFHDLIVRTWRVGIATNFFTGFERLDGIAFAIERKETIVNNIRMLLDLTGELKNCLIQK